MKKRTIFLCLICAMCSLTGIAWAKPPSFIPTGGRTVSFNWSCNDGAGYRWDISSNGGVNDGSNDAYDGGMMLRINNSQFYARNNRGVLDKTKREITIGPWNQNNQVTVYRRIYVAPKMGYCRWIDIFLNKTNAPQTVTVKYYTDGNANQYYTTLGKASPQSKDWGIFAGDGQNNSRPAVLHFYATKQAKVRPQVRVSNDKLFYTFSLKIPAGKARALCFFEAQRRNYAAAKKEFKKFPLAKEIRKIPRDLRKIIVNMPGATMSIGGLELTRNKKHDIVVLKDDNEIFGIIQNPKYVIQTIYGKLELPAARVVGLQAPSTDNHVQLGLADGQVVAGKLLNAPLTIQLSNGKEMSLPLHKINCASYKISPERPEEIAAAKPLLILRSGEHVFFDTSSLGYEFLTEQGRCKLSPDDIRQIQLDISEGGMHLVEFRNGSMLSGLLLDDKLNIPLALGPKLKTRRHGIKQIFFPGVKKENADNASVLLRNENLLNGVILNKTLTVRTSRGDVDLKPAEISEIGRVENAAGQITVKMHNDSTLVGKLVTETIELQLTPNLKLPIFSRHITKITFPQPEKPKTEPKPKPKKTEPAPKKGPALKKNKSVPPKAKVRIIEAKSEQEKAAKKAAMLNMLHKRAAALDNTLKQLRKAKGKKVTAACENIEARLKSIREMIIQLKNQ
ncbi:MAG: hypothetical protein K8S55_04270 [Phycisphaerae bacterium]|nr:hypothetical protein [Phycisphaerae bacterium]